MKSFIQFVTEFRGLAASEEESNQALYGAVKTYADAGKLPPKTQGEDESRRRHKVTSGADALQIRKNLANSAAGQVQQGVSGMGY